MFSFFKKKVDYTKIDPNNIPQHVAIIMDGNGRWAKKRGLPRQAGHVAGEGALTRTVEAAGRLGVKYLTVYAFSTENWVRPKEEIEGLMGLLKKAVKNRIAEMLKNGIRIRVLGRINELPKDVQDAIRESEERTKDCKNLTLNIMLNYGGQAEIVDAVKKIGAEVKSGKVTPEKIDEKVIADHLYTAGIPDPDLLIRTSGEQRISNYLLWQSAYTEFYFTKVLWPDFDQEHFKKAMLEYQQRRRRRGDIR